MAMATATKKVHVASSRAGTARSASSRAALAFVISQDNGGDYLWEIVDSRGEALVHSGGFSCHDDAERAAHYVHDSARLAHFGPREPEARRTVAA
jgi:uncharacterized protein YegP (UPF0339 family)